MKHFTFATALALTIVPCTAMSQRAEANPNAITQRQLRAYLNFIASDDLEGRDTPSRGLNIAAKFIASHLERWGLKPAGDNGTYFQSVAMGQMPVDPARSSASVGDKPFAHGTDFYLSRTAGEVDAGIVFAGNGWVIKESGVNPYQNLNVKGKIIAVVWPGNTPSPKGQLGKDFWDPSSFAKANGALGIAYLMSDEASHADALKRLETGDWGVQSPSKDVPAIYLGRKMTQALFADESVLNPLVSPTPKPFALSAGKRLHFKTALNAQVVTSQNVVAILPGSDPMLKDEFVAIGAHYDHVGMTNDASAKDKIFNGADDDGSGTVAVLSMAEALTSAVRAPKRSIIFVWHCGEEKGLWGSDYFTKNPTVPLSSIIAQLNIDMIGRSRPKGDTNPANAVLTGPQEIYVVGSKKISAEMGLVVESVNQKYLNLTYNFKYDNPSDPENIYQRSDHYNYARFGVPIAFFFDGVHVDYHQVSDEVDRIDFKKMESVARTIYLTLWELGERKNRPKVDHP